MQAYEDGAEIEFKVRTIRSQDWSVLLSSKSPLWNWADCNYRIKPTTHKIKIDGKEIEISEESYNKLKESLIKD